MKVERSPLDSRVRGSDILKMETWRDPVDETTKAIRDKILSVAKAKGTINYSEIAPLAQLDMSRELDRQRIGSILDDISRAEHLAGRPLLSAVVIRRDTNNPGTGFFELARELGLLSANEERDEYWVKELNRVHQHWS